MNEKKMIDIIIPIYNAYDDLKICLESIYKNTDLENNRLILINDNSPDVRIKQLLDEQCKKNIIVVHNTDNKGFSNNINIGMAQSIENDVILLNSDTIVTKGWIEKLSRCAYRDRTIGTVTPVSNNATLCSVPVFCQENKLPEGMDVEQVAEIVENCSMQKYPRITVAHGFCMYVKREVIDKIGNFDAETFEKGYGEENDFCNRAQLAGYHHVMCDDTYIYHSGTKSFVSKEKQKYIQAHDAILRKRYPDQMRANDIHVRDNPNHMIGENVNIFLKTNNGKKNILYVLQSDFRQGAENHVGGTQLHVKDLTSELRTKNNIYVAARNGAYLNLTIYLENEEIRFRYYIGEAAKIYEFHNDVQYYIWKQIINAFKIDLIHVHHTYGLSFDIFYLAKELDIPVIFTAHDFYFICPTIKMVNYKREICIGKNNNCSECLKKMSDIATQVDYIRIWREHCAEAMEICKQIIVPEESVKEVWNLYYPQFRDKLIDIEHGYQIDDEKKFNAASVSERFKYKIEKIEQEGKTYKIIGWTLLNRRKKEYVRVYLEIKNASGARVLVPTELQTRRDLEIKNNGDGVGFMAVIPTSILDNNPLKIKIVIYDKKQIISSNNIYTTGRLKKKPQTGINIAFIGGISREKGGSQITKIIKAMDKNVNWFVLGGIGDKSLEGLQQRNLIKTGFYNREDLSLLLKIHEIDMVAILSQLSETYSYTLTEALINKLPVIATDIGALGNRTRKSACGWTVSIDNTIGDFISIVEEIQRHLSMLDAYKKKCQHLIVKTTKEMSEEYLKLYEQYYNNVKMGEKADYEFIYNGYCDGSGNINMNSDMAQEVSELKRELAGIHESVAYQYAYKMSTKDFPGRKELRKILLKLKGN